MNMGTNYHRTILAFVAGLCVFGAYATDYYVDANNGNDDWDGTTATIPSQEVIDQGGTIPGPRKTLHAMMSDARVVAGDVVNAAEGDYNDGGDVYGTALTTNRVQVKAGVTLLATGARDATFISGANGIGDPYTNGSARCVYFLAPPNNAGYGYGIVKGFTLQNGRTAHTNEFGGASTGAGLLVECNFKGNGCKRSDRGGTMNVGTALRCRFSSYDKGYLAYNSGTKIIDSLIVPGAGIYQKCRLYNCTFTGNGYTRNGYTYNCFYIGNGAGSGSQANSGNYSYHYNTFSRSAFHETKCVTNETCRVVTAAESPYNTTTYRPLAGSVLSDAGDMSYYAAATNGWTAAWLAECGKDYYGNDRVANGTIDIGCGEMQSGSLLTITDSSDGLVVTGAAVGTARIPEGTSVNVTFSRNFTSDQLCTGVNVDGVFHSFGGTTSDVPYAVTLPAVFTRDYAITAVYETNQKDWYVSPTGDDANKGYHKDCPRKTLVKAMELATANADNIVHAAAGTYDEGEALASGCSNRVVVTAGVGLVADEWPLRETVIKGAADTTASADKNGNGTNAVRCAYVNNGGYVRGFKLTDGRTGPTSATTEVVKCGGGAYLSSGALVDCEITSVASSYRGPAVAGNSSSALIRCYVHDIVSGSFYVYGGRIIDTYISGNCYNCALVLNSTVTDQVRANGNLPVINTYMLYAGRAGAACTNCVFIRAADKAMSENATYDPETCRFSAALASNLDGNYRPKTSSSSLVDFGSKALYDKYFPSKWAQFKNSTDRTGGQRIYNGQIDVGCGEYDFRPDFAPCLGSKVVIEAMGPNVTTNDVPNIVVPEGESITVSTVPRSSSRETRYELVYTPEGGEQTVISEKSADAFSYTLDGACTVQSLDGYTGTLLLIR